MGYWWCPNCEEEVDGSRVTYQEKHDACGHSVEWIEDCATGMTGIERIAAERKRQIEEEGWTAEHREEEIGFGDYVEIEQKRYCGAENEMYLHKVINTLNSNSWVDVPVQTPATETLHKVKELEPVVSCICCGVVETEVRKYRIKDVKKVVISSNPDCNYKMKGHNVK